MNSLFKFFSSALATLLLLAPHAQACPVDNAYVGSVCIVAGSLCPSGTLMANGQQLKVAQYLGLSQTIGNRYGGDGVIDFNLPDLQGRSLVGSSASLLLGKSRGQEAVTLTSSNIPSLDASITFNVSTAVGNSDPSAETYLAGETEKNAKFYVKAPDNSSLVQIKGLELGRSVPIPMNVLPPQIALNFCVVVNGQVPPKPAPSNLAR